MAHNTKSILDLLVKCPHCGHTFRPGMEGRPDGSACYECEGPFILPEEQKVKDWADVYTQEADA